MVCMVEVPMMWVIKSHLDLNKVTSRKRSTVLHYLGLHKAKISKLMDFAQIGIKLPNRYPNYPHKILAQ